MLFFVLKKDKKSLSDTNGYTVEKDEILSVYELEGIYEFNMEILSVEKNYPINYSTSKIDSLAIKVKITNTGEHNLEVALLNFGIQDNLNNNISDFSIFSSAWISKQPGIFNFKTSLRKDDTITGYLFFYDTDKETSEKINSNNISKLVVGVPIYVSTDNGVLDVDYEQYYFNLK